MSAVPARIREPAGSGPLAEWAEIEQAAPALAATMRRYLRQAATFLRRAAWTSLTPRCGSWPGGS